MVKGFESFRKWFEGYEDNYTIIGGTACDLILTEMNQDFRATKDIDLVLILEALTPDFGQHFWDYIMQAGYEHRNKSTRQPQFYRFTDPASPEYPVMIELFSRKMTPSDYLKRPNSHRSHWMRMYQVSQPSFWMTATISS